MNKSDPYLDAASQAIQNGELDKAQGILTGFLNQNPRHTEAWFLLSATVDEPRAVALCLRNVLALDPRHDGAMNMMAQLEQQTGLDPLQVMQVGAGSAALEQTCPYCSSPFKALEEVVACPKCQISHHYECWIGNGHTCAATLCDGFSIRETYHKPLPLQPQKSEPEMIVIRKEEISDATTVTRKQQEQRFQRRLLLMALLAEEGQLPSGQADGLPSVDDLLDQIQRDRVTDSQPLVADLSPPADAEATPPPAQAPPSPYQASGVVTGIISIWPEQLQQDAPVESPAESCEDCGYDFRESKARFCPKCGRER